MQFDDQFMAWGIGGAIIGLIIWLAVVAFSLWITYLIIRAAVTSGIMRAADRGAFRGMNPGGPGGYPAQGHGGPSHNYPPQR